MKLEESEQTFVFLLLLETSLRGFQVWSLNGNEETSAACSSSCCSRMMMTLPLGVCFGTSFTGTYMRDHIEKLFQVNEMT